MEGVLCEYPRLMDSPPDLTARVAQLGQEVAALRAEVPPCVARWPGCGGRTSSCDNKSAIGRAGMLKRCGGLSSCNKQSNSSAARTRSCKLSSLGVKAKNNLPRSAPIIWKVRRSRRRRSGAGGSNPAVPVQSGGIMRTCRPWTSPWNCPRTNGPVRSAVKRYPPATRQSRSRSRSTCVPIAARSGGDASGGPAPVRAVPGPSRPPSRPH